jgi:alpha-beta hydrolase superfamily lysophospholipase
MPFFEGVTGPVYFRHWRVSNCDAVVAFLHGYGEHSGLYHRLGHELNRANVDLVALDQIGHGLSTGERAVIDSFDDLVENGQRLTDLAAATAPGAPVFVMGHSLGAITAALTVMEHPDRYAGAILTGSLLSPVPWVLDLVAAGDDATFELELADLSSEPQYLDEVENDPLGFTTDAGARTLARIIPPAWDLIARGFARVALPVLFIQGELDVLGPVETARSWASRLANARIVVFEGQRHDILNESVHADVAREIVSFIASNASPAGRSESTPTS